jgi:hypothetical protein
MQNSKPQKVLHIWQEVAPRRDKKGMRWNFRVWTWHGVVTKNDILIDAYRIFFWNDKRSFCGVVLIFPAARFSRTRQLIEKLVADAEFRSKYKRVLKFPIERYYSEYGAFPEEQINLENFLSSLNR